MHFCRWQSKLQRAAHVLSSRVLLQVKAHSIIVATGATAKRLGIPSEEKFWSQGISACAICDGAHFPAARQPLLQNGLTCITVSVYEWLCLLQRSCMLSAVVIALVCSSWVSYPVVLGRQNKARAGASYSFRNQELAVVGGGDTAVEEAIYLTKYGSKASP